MRVMEESEGFFTSSTPVFRHSFKGRICACALVANGTKLERPLAFGQNCQPYLKCKNVPYLMLKCRMLFWNDTGRRLTTLYFSVVLYIHLFSMQIHIVSRRFAFKNVSYQAAG